MAQDEKPGAFYDEENPSLLAHGEQLEAFYDEEKENLRLKVFSSSLSRNEGSCFCRILRAKKRQSGLQLSFGEETSPLAYPEYN